MTQDPDNPSSTPLYDLSAVPAKTPAKSLQGLVTRLFDTTTQAGITCWIPDANNHHLVLSPGINPNAVLTRLGFKRESGLAIKTEAQRWSMSAETMKRALDSAGITDAETVLGNPKKLKAAVRQIIGGNGSADCDKIRVQANRSRVLIEDVPFGMPLTRLVPAEERHNVVVSGGTATVTIPAASVKHVLNSITR